jgi:hypothetical protein
MVYKIYTQKFANVPEIVSRYFEGFTLFEGKGYWKGEGEESLVVEVVTGDRANVYAMAREIKEVNKQECVLVVASATTKERFV